MKNDGGTIEEIAFTPIPGAHYRLIQANLRAHTDRHAELLAEREWLLHANEADLRLCGNAFAVENVIDGTGIVLVKFAPLPEERPEPSEWDLRVAARGPILLNRADSYSWATAPYAGGKWGRIIALHRLQREIRPYDHTRDGLLLSNTWGDRSLDSRLNTEFMLGEIASGARLGVDIVQIDDGWQTGVSANALASRGKGVWTGFWAADPNFWNIHPTRFPDGFSPLVAAARTHNLQLGLWFAPDSSHDFANWQRDAEVLIRLYREWGIAFFKIDAVQIDTKAGEANFAKFLAELRRETADSITLDLDITAGTRCGPFGQIAAGPLFVENRYTDWGGYYPHHTLRVAWQLAHWIDPVRLRLEWLNISRNIEKYSSDPLAPANWTPDALFASVMFMSPLGWFETQNLPESYFEQAAPVIHRWKQHRAAIQSGEILPIGSAPDGVCWTGFVSISPTRDCAYALAFRELNPEARYEFSLPLLTKQEGRCEILGGAGTAKWTDGRLQVDVPNKLGYVWVRVG